MPSGYAWLERVLGVFQRVLENVFQGGRRVCLRVSRNVRRCIRLREGG